jgi:hypothetical protein
VWRRKPDARMMRLARIAYDVKLEAEKLDGGVCIQGS